jgi:exodeoxyribonuclease V alpha subunit
MSAVADPFDARRAISAAGLLRVFNDAGVLSAADVHVATRLGALAGEEDEAVKLAVALAVRAPRLGHVFADLATIRESATVESEEPVDLSALPWPTPGAWLRAVEASPLVALGDALGDEEAGDGEPAPLRLLGTRLYLDRYWREERSVAADVNELTASGRLHVIAGGPGTGKTTKVARIVGELVEPSGRGDPEPSRPPLIALAAPTGKAAARLHEVVHEETGLDLRASTLHRLLGWRPGTHSRFAHDRYNRLPHDVVIVDEASMVSLWLMARLVEAVRPDARLIMVGDPGQLTSIEAGVVLADIVAAGRGVEMLEHVHRYGGGIARLADAVRLGDGDAVLAALGATGREITWLPVDLDEHGAEAALGVVRERATAAGRDMFEAARDGRARDALRALGEFRLLCAHRRGPYGVSDWSSRVVAWLSSELADLDVDRRDYVGRPLLVTENDYELGLYNGDTGVIVQDAGGRAMATFERGGELLPFSPLQLGAVETVYAMTIHKSQGSQFETVAVLLPPAGSRILTRELLYTAITRARRELFLVGSEETVRRAVARPVARASGLAERLR